MRRFFDNRLLVFIIGATIVLAIVIGIFASVDRDASVAEKVGGEVMTPAQGVVSETGGFFKGIFGYFGNVKSLRRENEELRNENTNLQKQIKDMQGLDKENKELRKMLDLRKKQTKVDLLAASVASKDPSNWYSTFKINRGTKDGVERNQAVVNGNRELVGQIFKVGDNWAEVITILDSQSSIGAEVQRSGETGIIEGDGNLRYSGMCKLGYIARDTDIREGDFIETSGLGGVFPKGLLIGTVKEVREENATMSKVATIKPLADIDSLGEVFVVTGYDEVDLSEEPEDEEDSDEEDDEDDEDNKDNDTKEDKNEDVDEDEEEEENSQII